MNVLSPMLRGGLWLGLAAAALSGVARAEGTGLLDKTSQAKSPAVASSTS